MAAGFARQQCRAWIETLAVLDRSVVSSDSPGSNAGRGLKHVCWRGFGLLCTDSPGSNAGRGLKRYMPEGGALSYQIRPAAMPGVD